MTDPAEPRGTAGNDRPTPPEGGGADPPQVRSAAVWKGAELLSRADWLQHFTPDEAAELADAAQRLGDVPYEEITRETFLLPRLESRLGEIQQSLEQGSGAAWIRGIDASHYGEAQLTSMFWGLMLHLGTPVSQSAAGQRLFHVRDAGYSGDDPRARGPNTRKRLRFHTDRCDVIGFFCMRQAKSGGENQLVSSAALYNEMRQQRPDLLAELMKPWYYQRHNVDLGNPLPFCRQPIFSFCEGHFAGSYLRVLIDRAYAAEETPVMTAQQREALDFLDALAEDPALHVEFRLAPGDVLLLNNWTTFHRRSEFVDFDEPAERRHLLRAWLSMPNSRPIDPLFRDNYGATAAGALRGGMPARSGMRR